MTPRVVITKRLDFLAVTEARLVTGARVEYAASIAPDDVVAAARGADAVIATRGVTLGADFLDQCPTVRIVAVPTAGYDGIDVDALTRAGVPLIANTGVAPGPVVEFTIGCVLMLSRRILDADRALRTERSWSARARFASWDGQIGTDLAACTIGIVGVGHIGASVARVLRSTFGATVLGLDPFLTEEAAGTLGIEKVVDPLELARRSDFVLLHAPLTDETQHLVSADFLGAMKPTSYLVNCARGPIVDEASLVEALRERRIAGAALDVFEQEPIDRENPLLELDNVVVTPHIAGVTRQSDEARAEQVAERLLEALNGRIPTGLVNREVWPQYESRVRERVSSTL